MRTNFNRWIIYVMVCVSFFSFNGQANPLVNTLTKIKPSVVGIGIYTPTASPKHRLTGTGFAILDGKHIVTNHHVVPPTLDDALLQEFVVYVGNGKNPDVRKAQVIASSDYHDLAILKIEGNALPAMHLASADYILEGTEIAFTGYPIGAVLGLYPVTHRGIVSAISPVVIPTDSASNLSIKMLKRLRDPYLVYQLDATAYPGNSGSAVYDMSNGDVVAVINKVFVKETKEAVIENPSGITYAIPVKHIHELIESSKLALSR